MAYSGHAGSRGVGLGLGLGWGWPVNLAYRSRTNAAVPGGVPSSISHGASSVCAREGRREQHEGSPKGGSHGSRGQDGVVPIHHNVQR